MRALGAGAVLGRGGSVFDALSLSRAKNMSASSRSSGCRASPSSSLRRGSDRTTECRAEGRDMQGLPSMSSWRSLESVRSTPTALSRSNSSLRYRQSTDNEGSAASGERSCTRLLERNSFCRRRDVRPSSDCTLLKLRLSSRRFSKGENCDSAVKALCESETISRAPPSRIATSSSKPVCASPRMISSRTSSTESSLVHSSTVLMVMRFSGAPLPAAATPRRPLLRPPPTSPPSPLGGGPSSLRSSAPPAETDAIAAFQPLSLPASPSLR
mmetsp:Transcript_3912/g.14537  ORF Transcript_3912/g.14537 Transcript_3912/m.14537 type:complete len:270 (+) Transcript_3912:1512-2321(+)